MNLLKYILLFVWYQPVSDIECCWQTSDDISFVKVLFTHLSCGVVCANASAPGSGSWRCGAPTSSGENGPSSCRRTLTHGYTSHHCTNTKRCRTARHCQSKARVKAQRAASHWAPPASGGGLAEGCRTSRYLTDSDNA